MELLYPKKKKKIKNLNIQQQNTSCLVQKYKPIISVIPETEVEGWQVPDQPQQYSETLS